MLMEMIKNWEVAVDGIQILLCLLILFFLMRNHRRRRKHESAVLNQNYGQDFNIQVFSQTINQQIELAFANIENAVDGGRRNIEKVLQMQQIKSLDPSPLETRPSSPPTLSGGSFQKSDEVAGPGALQTRIRKMTSRGMSPKQIANELKTPLGEVELILNMQKSA
jgi:hypothetical protein